jgi:hypothetical protein
MAPPTIDSTREPYEGIYAGGVERLLAWAAGKPIDVMNPEALQREKG